ncbi:hypothetical protein [Xanthomarina spongicola]|uniref:Uncharacterized protein n=1 Tax=Xanthomarina spongicola TaxID=570520 RepID=A0A316E8R8_9FLAO|nr:hypothetical protein [Xanthomarina spongicola]PWK19290.1 hypothetical protein LX78_01771 [Xanthomarina spongicola]
MNKYLIFLLALTVNFSFSQSASISSRNDFSNSRTLMSNNGLWITNSTASSEIKGTPYLFDSWNSDNALIYMSDNRAYKIRSINYNVQLERFEAKFAEDSVLALNPKNIKKIDINSRTFKRYLDPQYQRNSYFEELVKTKSLTILRKFETEIVEGNFNPMTQQKITPDQMVKIEKYYSTEDGETLSEMKLSKGAILKLIDSDKKDAVKQHAKDNSLNYKDINDLKAIIKYYNTL